MSDSDPISWLRRTGKGSATPAPPAAAPVAPPPMKPAGPAGPAAPASPPSFDEPAGYRAYGRGHPEAKLFEVRLKPEAQFQTQGELLPLFHLLRITYATGSMGDFVTLSFADCIITARGFNLKELRGDLIAGKVDFIEQHNAKRWGQPVDGEPIILDIDITAPGRSTRKGSA